MKNIFLAALAALALAAAPARAGSQPQRALDECYGKPLAVHVKGWAYDPDVSSQSIDVHVYLYTDSGCTSRYGDIRVLTANVPRPDVNQAKGITGDHGFDADIPVADAGDYWVKVFAIDATGDGNPQIGSTRSVTVAAVFPGAGISSDPYLISTTAEWNAFASCVNAGINGAAFYRLAADIGPVSSTVGTEDHPFTGTFDGGGHAIDLAIADTGNQGAAPFRHIAGATIMNAKTTGSVTGTLHCAGLVGFAQGSRNRILQCEVAADIVCGGGAHSHCGGILGHGKSSSTRILNGLFSGTISGATTATGVIYGWGDDGTHTIENCLSTGTFTDCGGIELMRTNKGTASIVNCFRKNGGGSQGTDASGMTADELLSALGPGWEVRDHAIRPALLGDRSLVFATIRGLEAFQLSGLAAFARPVVEVEDFHGAIVAPSCYTVTIRDGDGAIVAGDLAASASYTLTVQAADGNAGAYTDSATASFTCPLAVFVDAGAGDDANDGLAPTSAFQSIQRAIDLSESGAIVFVAAGIYEPVYVHDKTLTIIGADAASTVIDGDDMDCCATLSSGTTLRNFTIRNGLAAAEDGTLEDCIVENCSDDRVLLGTDTIRCIVRNSLSGDSCVIDGGVHRNTLFHGLSGHYIFGDSTLYNCTVANNAADWGDAEDYHIGEQNPEYDSGQLFCGGSRFNCIVWDNTRSEGLDEYLRPIWSPCPENDAADPVFLDPGRGNFRLRGESPAIDSGNSAYAPQAGATDLDGRPRVQGAAIDRGCYEGAADVVVTAASVGCGTVSPPLIALKAPGTATFTADAAGWNRPVAGWYTNGVLAANSGDTFTLSGVTEDTAVVVRFAAADWYADASSGDDANDGLSAGTAFRTVQRAFAAAARDDAIHLAAGTYGPIDDHGGRVSIAGAGAGATIVDGGGSSCCATLAGGTTLRRLTLRNGRGSEGGGARGGALEDCVVENCSGYSGAVRDADTLRCIVRNCSADRDVVSGGTHRNSLFHGLVGNRAFYGATLYSCTVADSTGWWRFREEGAARNCVFWGNSAGNDAEDPLFAGASAGDYRLRAESPAIDAGDLAFATEAGETDLAGNPRVQGAAIDRGCHEGGVAGLVRCTAAVEGFGGTVSPASFQTNAPATVTFTSQPAGFFARPVAGWYTNGVLASSSGGTFTLTDVTEDVAVTVRFEPTELHVDVVAGDDANDGLSPATALRTIAAAIDIAASGDTVHAAAGTYAPIDTRGRTVSIVGAGAASTAVDGGGSERCALLSGGSTLTGFTLRNGRASAESDAVVKNGGLVDCVVENCRVDGSYASLLRDVGTLRCIVRRCSSSAAYGTIRGGTHRCTLFHSLRGEIWFFESAPTLYNCTFADNSAKYLMQYGTFFNCILWGNSSQDGAVCNDAQDPRFVDAPGGDYRLRAGSPAIDAGDAAYAGEAGETDVAGNARVQGAAIDRGCYEGPGLQGIRIAASAEGHGAVSPGCAYVQGPAESVLFTADTSVWGCPVVAWLTNGVLAAEGGDTFRIDGVTEDVAVTVKFAPGTLYVDASGNDSNDGSSPARALRTLQRAINVSGSGDTIRVASGGYSPIDVGGRTLTIVGAGAGSTTIDGGGRNRCATLTPETTLRGFTLRNGIAKGWVLDSYIWESTDWNSVVKFGTLEDCVVENCQAEQSAAVFFWTSTRRCIVRNCRAKEFIVFGGVHANSLFHGNESEDMPVLQAIESYNCTFFSNATQYAWFLDGFPIVNSIRWNNSYSLSGMAPVQQNSTNDPMFVDAPAGNFRLRRGSPAIDAGISPTNQLASGCGSIDLEGKPRLQGETFDLGCYESPASDGYAFWSWMWGLGAWDAIDANGIHNVFRYLFDKPSGTFENPPLLSISFDASGRAVIHTPPLNPSATGFDISILATDDLNGTGATTYPLDADGETTIPASGKPARFFRLRVEERP